MQPARFLTFDIFYGLALFSGIALPQLAHAQDQTVQEEQFESRQNSKNGPRNQQPKTRDDLTSSAAGFEISAKELSLLPGIDFQTTILPLFNTYCVRCHGGESTSGVFDFPKASRELPFVRHQELWTNVIEQIKNRVMPPIDEVQPTDKERRLIAHWLKHQIEHFDYSQVDDPGFEPTRRLTHQEYNNSIRDLIGINLSPADRFPADLSGTSGFHNSANTLFIQPTLLDRYIGAAEFVVANAFPLHPNTKEQQRSRQIVFGENFPHSEPESSVAKQILKRFLARTYRRPIQHKELANSLHVFQSARDNGDNFHAAISRALETALISPKFLLHVERPRNSVTPYAVSHWELASRLSYFLWASMPDNELFQLAKDGSLSKPKILKQQVLRMLADKKADTLGNIFAAQWFGFQHLGTRVRADPIDNPWCTDSLIEAMRNESAMFFVSLVRDNRSVARIINAKYTFLNEELAQHYGIPNITGSTMQRVPLATRQRGGILTQGSLLAVTSFPGRTSPVRRGTWILTDILGTPPPPPPPNASDFDDELEDRDALTRRQKLESHRQNPHCYACHSRIDPLGFTLENYDWFGRWRSRQGRRRIDASGKLPDGTELNGPLDLKKVLVKQHLDKLVRQFARKMLAYALGRQLEYYDEPAIRKIVAAVAADNYRIQTLVLEITNSYPFRFKKNRSSVSK
ncbi:MAG: DUF1592 domain-containing protein [Pirellulaceae bacterium]|nr:DUF1592 domain-containing protein [Pirellulaceae bacterium]